MPPADDDRFVERDKRRARRGRLADGWRQPAPSAAPSLRNALIVCAIVAAIVASLFALNG